MNVIKPTRMYAQNDEFKRSMSAQCYIFSVSPLISEEEIHDKREDTDVYLADQGYVTLVPVQVDQTNYEGLNRLKELL